MASASGDSTKHKSCLQGCWRVVYIMLMLMELSQELCRYRNRHWHVYYMLYITGLGCSYDDSGIMPWCYTSVMDVCQVFSDNTPLYIHRQSNLSNNHLFILYQMKWTSSRICPAWQNRSWYWKREWFLHSWTRPSKIVSFEEMCSPCITGQQLPIKTSEGQMDNPLSHWWLMVRFEFMSRALQVADWVSGGGAMSLLWRRAERDVVYDVRWKVVRTGEKCMYVNLC